MARFGKDDWLDLGLKALGEKGPDGLTIDALTARAGKTRGSFYHHFESMDVYRTALGQHWRRTYTDDIIEKVNKRGADDGRLDHLNRLAAWLDPQVEQGMRALAGGDPAIARVVHEVDEVRVAFIEKLYGAETRFSGDDAKALARIEYAAFIGFQTMALPPADSIKLYEAFMRLTGRG